MSSKGRQSVIQYGLMVVTVLPVLLAAVKTIQLLYFYDETTGMLDSGGGAQVFQWILLIGAAVVAAMGVWMSVEINQVSDKCRLGRPLIMGIGLFIAGLCFMGQSVTDLLTVLNDRRLKIGGPTGDIGYLQVAVSIFGLVAAVVLIAMAYAVIATGRQPNLLLCLVPAAWCVLFMLNLLLTYENLVSMQDNTYKTITGVLALLFLYYFGRSMGGLDGGAGAKPGVFIRVLFPGLGFMATAPYCIAYVCGVHDRAGNMPYLALLGLAIFAGIALMQLSVGTLLGLRRPKQERDAADSGFEPPKNI